MIKTNIKQISLGLMVGVGLLLAYSMPNLANAADQSSNTTITAQLCQGGERTPAVALTTPANNSVVNTSSTNFDFDVDWGNRISISVNGNPVVTNDNITYQENLTYSRNLTLTPANNTILVTIAGGCPESTINQSFTINYDDSMVSVNSLSTNDSTPELTGSISNTSADIRINVNGVNYNATNNGDGTWTLADNTISPALADGQYDVRITTFEQGTSTQLVDQNFQDILLIDATPPNATIDTDNSDERSPELNGTIDDPDATVTIEINGNTYSATNNGDGTWTVPAGTIADLTNGEYIIIAHAIDIYGNETTTQQLIVIKADNQIGFVLPPNTGYFRIHHTNIPTWSVYLLIIMILTLFGLKKRKKQQ